MLYKIYNSCIYTFNEKIMERIIYLEIKSVGDEISVKI